MTFKERKQMFDRIYQRYCGEMWIHGDENAAEDEAYSYIIRREIVLPKKAFSNPSEWMILVLLHEIGHIKTNTRNMKVYEKEFTATQWSAKEARRIGFCVRNEWKNVFQDYIWDKRQNCINRNGKNVASKESLVVVW